MHDTDDWSEDLLNSLASPPGTPRKESLVMLYKPTMVELNPNPFSNRIGTLRAVVEGFGRLAVSLSFKFLPERGCWPWRNLESTNQRLLCDGQAAVRPYVALHIWPRTFPSVTCSSVGSTSEPVIAAQMEWMTGMGTLRPTD